MRQSLTVPVGDGEMDTVPGDWEIRRLDEVARFASGGTPSKARPEWWTGTVPWVSPKDMKVPRLDSVTDHITEEAATAGSRVVPAKSIFVVVRGMVLAKTVPVAIAERPMAFNQDMKAVIARDGIDPDFLFYAIRHQTPTLTREISTSAHGTRRMGASAVESLRVALPRNRFEQSRIVEVLRRLEDAVAAQGRAVAALKDLKAATMAKLFREGLRGEPTRATPFGDAPASWSVMPLDACATVQTGIAKGKAVRGTVVERPYLRVANVQSGYLDLAEIKTIRLSTDELPRYLLRDGDVLVTEGGDFDKLGRGYIWRNQIPDCVHQNHIFAVRTNPRTLQPDFLAHLVQSPYGRSYFLTVAHKTTNLACINTTKLKQMPVPLPSPDEQVAIAERIHSIDCALRAAAAKERSLRALAGRTLAVLMSGQIRVTSLLEE